MKAINYTINHVQENYTISFKKSPSGCHSELMHANFRDFDVGFFFAAI